MIDKDIELERAALKCAQTLHNYSVTHEYSIEAIANDAFYSGAKFMEKQYVWHDIIKNPDDLPEKGDKVLCCMRSNGEIVSGYIYINNGKPTLATDSNFEIEDYCNYEVEAWMKMQEFKE